MAATIQHAASPTIDTHYLATFFKYNESNLSSLTTHPTTDLVTAFLLSVTRKAEEFETLKAQKLQSDVELESAVRTSDVKNRAQKAAVTRQSKEIEQLRIKLSEAESNCDSYLTQVQELKAKTSELNTRAETFKSRIEAVETSNRDTLTLLESQSTEKDRVYKELEEQHTKIVTLRQENGKLEEKNQSLGSEISSQKFKHQSLRSELDLLKIANERQANDLKTASQEHNKSRKDRNARINVLEQERDIALAQVTTLQQTESSLRRRLDEVERKTEEAFAKYAEIQNTATQDAQRARTQLDSTKRLAELQTQSAATHKARLEDLQTQIELIRDDAAEEIARLQVEVETERGDKVQAEKTIAELELRLENQEHRSIPGTPTGNGIMTIPGSAQKMVRNLTNTQLYANYVEAKQDLDSESRRSAKLQTALDELIQEMESRAPEMVELRGEQDRLEGEIISFSRMLDEANETRDAAVRESQKRQDDCAATAREGEILRQQLRDLSAQVKVLLVELRSKEQGLEDMTTQERLELERAAHGQQQTIANDTQQWISDRLLIFRDVADLQNRNEELLRVIRQLGDQMEGEEAQAKARQSAVNATENHELRAQIERYKDEMQATAVQIDSYMKERDMFRRMLQHRGSLAPDADMAAIFGSSIMSGTPQRNGTEPATPRSKDVEDLNKLLKEQQTFFDQFRNETASDRRTLKDQVDALAQEKSTLQLDIARAQSKLTLASDRYELLHSNLVNLRNENMELQKRSSILSENAAKQDLRTQQVAEELVDARSQTEALQNDKNNTRAEKELWKRLEDRLIDENKQLHDERGKISKLNTDLSHLMNEQKRDTDEARNRVHKQVQTLESEIAELRRKLDSEVETSKKVALRREYEESQNRTRIEDLTKSLGLTREELAAAKTTKDQLQTRLDEMKIDLRAAEGKAMALQSRPSGTAADANMGQLSSEQQLGVELSDSKRALDFARSELDSARQQIEQYKSIAQTTEEELASFNQTSEQYREESDAQMTEKDAKIKQLEQRIEDLISELTATNAELSDLRTRHDNASQEVAVQKAQLEAELVRLTEDAKRHAEDKQLYQEDLKAQAEIAQQAQHSYDSELVKHADAARGFQAARQEVNDLRIEIAGVRADADAAKVGLEHGQESWSEQKASLQREIIELNQRRIDIDAQNKILHQQLETFSAELSNLRRGRASGEDGNAVTTADANLQEVITFLRREKEIIEVQHELAVQEGGRLQQQLDYANGQVDELHAKLAEERKQNAERASSEASTSKLTQTLNELNLFRESSVTLRNEARQARERFEVKNKEVDDLLAELQPLQAKLAELEADVEVKDGEIRLITSDRDHWRDRTQNIISKYDRVDPAELEELKSRIESLETEKEQLKSEQSPLREQAEAAEQRVTEIETSSNDRLERLKDQAKAKAREQNTRISELRNELTAAQTEQSRVTAELDNAKGELDSAKAELLRAATQTSTTNEPSGLSDEEAAGLRSRLAEADAQASVRTVEVEKLQSRVQELEQQVEVLTAELNNEQSEDGSEGTEQGEIVEDVANDAEMSEAAKDFDASEDITLTDAALVAQKGSRPTQMQIELLEEQSRNNVAIEVARLRTEMEQQHELAMQQVQEAADAKIARMKSNLARQLTEQKAQIQEDARAALITDHSAQLQAIRDDYEQQITTLKETHLVELARLKTDADAENTRIASNTTIGSNVGEDATNTPEITDEYVNELMKTNHRVRTVMQNSVRKTVAKETERLSQALVAKDAEIATLMESPSEEQPASGQISEEMFRDALENARKDKVAAVLSATDQAEKKAKVQLSQRDMAQAKVAVVSKAAIDTPQRAVADVWEEAKKARPVPKPMSLPTTTAVPSAIPNKQNPQTTPAQDSPQNDEAAKLRARRQRFGTGADANSVNTGTFGQPSIFSNANQVKSGTFGQASDAAEQESSAPDPEAAPFVPAGEASSTARANGSGIPTAANGRGGRGGARVPSVNYPIMGAATRNQPASSIARASHNSNRGGAKRQHEGDSGGGDGKRARGGPSA